MEPLLPTSPPGTVAQTPSSAARRNVSAPAPQVVRPDIASRAFGTALDEAMTTVTTQHRAPGAPCTSPDGSNGARPPVHRQRV